MKKAIEMAQKAGVGTVSVFNSSHFGAAAYFASAAAEKDMIGLAFTQATAHVVPHGGIRPFLGNNPFCLVAPCLNEKPFCFDMATTKATFNKVQSYAEKKEELPSGWALDKNGLATTDPSKVLSLLPIGSYKGFGLSMALDILCSLLTGMDYGPNVSAMFGNSMSKKRNLGHFLIAINIANFVNIKVFKTRLQQIMDDLRREPADGLAEVLVAGDPEKKMFKKRNKLGLPLDDKLFNILSKLAPELLLEI